jgi:ribosomal protein L20A (L18A)
MIMKAYHVKGTFQMGINKRQPFTLECAAKDEPAAKEFAFSDLGSRHGVVRRLINIESVTEQPLDKVGNPRVRYLVEREA